MSELNSKNIKRYNRKQVLNVLRKNEEISVKEITAITGISRTSVARSIQKFIKQGLVNERGKGESTLEGGKRPVLYSMDKKFRVFAICNTLPDIFYTVISDLCGNVVAEVATKITHDLSSQNIVNGIITDIKTLLVKNNIGIDRVHAMAVGVPGIANIRTGEFLQAPHCEQIGRNINLKKLLLDELGVEIPCYIDNQIRFQCYAEQKFGFGRQHDNFILLEAEDGLVAGIVIDKKIGYGSECIAGEIGHMMIDPADDVKCFCGGYGCLENKVSGSGVARILKKYEQDIKNEANITISEESGKVIFNELFAAADNGDKLAIEVVDELAKWFAFGISNLILTVNPETIVFQGSYANASGFFDESLKKYLNTRLLSSLSITPKITYSVLGNKCCITGAAIFLADHFFDEYQ